jgi:5-methylcytosine-specific restriction endonuclease McrA
VSVSHTKDGRTVLTGKDYTELREAVFFRDRGRCIVCHQRVSLKLSGSDWDMHLCHITPRRMGGGSRDDTKENTVTKCKKCHMKEHNQ